MPSGISDPSCKSTAELVIKWPTFLFKSRALPWRVSFSPFFDFLVLKISKKDAFKQYLAYHEGWGNYKYYKKNKKVISLAKKVEKQSKVYKNQLSKCSKTLSKNKYIIF